MARRQTKRTSGRKTSSRRKGKGGARLPLLRFKWILLALGVVLALAIFRTLVITRDYRDYTRGKARWIIYRLSRQEGWSLVSTDWVDRRDRNHRWVMAITVWRVEGRPQKALEGLSRSQRGLVIRARGAGWSCYSKGVEVLRIMVLPPSPGGISHPSRERSPLAKAREGPRVAIVIDDMGYRMDLARAFLSIPYPITFSIIPFTPKAREVAILVHQKGHEVMLHIPMDANGGGEAIERLESRTPGMLLVSMSGDELRRLLREEMAQVPYAHGANNHMGSRFTRDPRCMDVVLEELKARGYYFLDSLTDSRSVACREARKVGIKCYRRDVFLDNSRDVSYILHQMDLLARLALKRGHAIAIGHPSRETLEALKKGLPKLEKRGIKVVPLSEL